MIEVRRIEYCDVHYAKEERAEGRSIIFNGKKFELCDGCEEALAISELYALAEEFGRKPDSDTMKKRRHQTPLFVATEDEPNLMCPFDTSHNKGKPYASQNRLRTHMLKAHPDGASID